jgi:hypothetical protein
MKKHIVLLFLLVVNGAGRSNVSCGRRPAWSYAGELGGPEDLEYQVSGDK